LHIIAHPTFVSAKADVQLLFLVSEHFRLNGTKSVNGVELFRLVEMMHRAALVRVHSNDNPSYQGSRIDADCSAIPDVPAQQGATGQVGLMDGAESAMFALWPDVNSMERNVTSGSNGYLFGGF
jgi:hypothetical protein